jgi:hypothetical protein
MSKKAKDSIIKKLKGDNSFNPFNGKFDYQIVHKEISKALENENSTEKIDLLTGLSTIVFNSYYVDYYNCVRSIINSIGSIGINPEQLTQYFIFIANYNYYQLLKNIQGKMSNQETANFSDYLKFKFKPNIFEPTDAIASLETWFNHSTKRKDMAVRNDSNASTKVFKGFDAHLRLNPPVNTKSSSITPFSA